MNTAANTYSLPLAVLLQAVNIPCDRSVQLTGLTLDSRKVRPGDAFMALKGHTLDGRQYVFDAIRRGAAAVLVEDQALRGETENDDVPVIAVPNLSQKVSLLAGNFYGHPSASMNVIGVTGTNGKSTCVNLLAQLANALGRKSSAVGTLGVIAEGKIISDTEGTTPDAISCQRILAQLRDQGVSTVAMEVSSHGLAQHRVAAVQFRAAVFTNLTQDHLDYHSTFDEYALAKSRLFSVSGLQFTVLNLDDPAHDQMRKAAKGKTQVVTYSLESARADVYADNIRYGLNQTLFDVKTPWGNATISSPLWGAFNVYNLLAVLTTLCAQGASFTHAAALCAKLEPVKGRMQCVSDAHHDISVFVDYAHTPDALEKVLQALREKLSGRLWCVFGCGGDRDRAKRSQMGNISERWADQVVVTSDNPRTEDPAVIADDICHGFSRVTPIVELDRAGAIQTAIVQAAPGDVVLIAGKGHEQYQHIGSERLCFSDEAVAGEALSRRVKLKHKEGKA